MVKKIDNFSVIEQVDVSEYGFNEDSDDDERENNKLYPYKQ